METWVYKLEMGDLIMKEIKDNFFSLPKTIQLFLSAFIVLFLLKISETGERFFNFLIQIGINDEEIKSLFQEGFMSTNDSIVAIILGKVLGSFLFIYLFINLVNRKSWARNLLIGLSFFSLAIFIYNLKNFFILYNNFGPNNLWTGFYLSLLFLFTVKIYLVMIIILFTRPKIREIFQK